MSQNAPRKWLFRGDLQAVDSLDLWSRCAADMEDTELWSELLRRFAPKMKMFVRITLRQSLHCSSPQGDSSVLEGGTQESDLFQIMTVRLLQNGCAAMKRFSGSSEEDLLAYLAVIARSVVRDFVRQQNALKRPSSRASLPESSMDWTPKSNTQGLRKGFAIERNLLVREVTELSIRKLDALTGQFSDRDRLIFHLHFFDGLSANQISRCEGIELTRRGVEDVLNRLKHLVRTAVGDGASEAMTK